jgi:hypothetical protein
MRRGTEGPKVDCICYEKNNKMMINKERNDRKGLPKYNPNLSSTLFLFTPIPNSNAIDQNLIKGDLKI